MFLLLSFTRYFWMRSKFTGFSDWVLGLTTFQMLIWITGCDEHSGIFSVGHFCPLSLKLTLEMLCLHGVLTYEGWREMPENPLTFSLRSMSHGGSKEERFHGLYLHCLLGALLQCSWFKLAASKDPELKSSLPFLAWLPQINLKAQTRLMLELIKYNE